MLYNIGLIQYDQSLYDDAEETFDLAVEEQRNALGGFHPDVAEMYLSVGKLKLDAGKIESAMDDFLNALMIMRVIEGNNALEILDILYHIGMIHEINGEYIEALNSFHQSLGITRSIQDEKCNIIILHKIFLIHHQMGDIDNAIKSLQDIVTIIKGKVGKRHVCKAPVLGLLRGLYIEQGTIEMSEEMTNEIKDISYYTPEQLACDDQIKFIEFIVEEFGCTLEDNFIIAAAAA